ncbi:MAG: hypothetical protein H0U49_13120, partial [Parachlamydiaceae bacterium]|nr:hypothetical protein [Parachlamydiaceae bacterium]
MEASSYISAAQVSFSEFKTFIFEQATAHPITTIFLVVLPFLGIAALGVLGIRKIYQSYHTPTVDKIKSIDNPVVNQNANTKAAEKTQTDPKGVVREKPFSNFTFTAKIVSLVALMVIGSSVHYYARPSIVFEPLYGWYSNWRYGVAPQMITDATVDLATQCSTLYSFGQGGYSTSQYLYVATWILGMPTKVKNYASAKCSEAIG